MENFDIESIKDAVYELEGLLELAELREDKLTALLPLMKGKLKIINTLFGEAKEEPVESENEEFYQESYPEEDDEPEDEVEQEYEDPQEYDVPADDSMKGETDADGYSSEDDEPGDSEPEHLRFVHDDPSSEVIAEPETETEIYDLSFSSTDDNEIEKPGQEDIREGAIQKSKASGTVCKPAFCINDRFRFRRELFNNSDADFNAAMDLVATMEDYEEAEAYFLGEKDWNPEKEEVMDFMAIIRSYFEK